MNWNNHSELEGTHAFLSPSSYHWTNYTPEKLETVYRNVRAREEGTWMHNFASMAIQKKLKLARNKKTINMFVNDCIGFMMESEVMLYYSPNAYGTTDAISFKDNVLKIFDYKNGVTKASFKQLDVYAAIFCLEYGIDPRTIVIEQRIYQNNAFEESIPPPEHIQHIMNTIVSFDELIESIKNEER